jgi:hypothetical protein
VERIIHLKPNAQEIETWIATIDNVVVGHIYMKVEKDNKEVIGNCGKLDGNMSMIITKTGLFMLGQKMKAYHF